MQKICRTFVDQWSKNFDAEKIQKLSSADRKIMKAAINCALTAEINPKNPITRGSLLKLTAKLSGKESPEKIRSKTFTAKISRTFQNLIHKRTGSKKLFNELTHASDKITKTQEKELEKAKSELSSTDSSSPSITDSEIDESFDTGVLVSSTKDKSPPDIKSKEKTASTKTSPDVAIKKINKRIDNYVLDAKDRLNSYQIQTKPGAETKESIRNKWENYEGLQETAMFKYIDTFNNISLSEKTGLKDEFKSKLGVLTVSFDHWVDNNPTLFKDVSKTSPTSSDEPTIETVSSSSETEKVSTPLERIQQKVDDAIYILKSIATPNPYIYASLDSADNEKIKWNEFIDAEEGKTFKLINDFEGITREEKTKLKKDFKTQSDEITRSFHKWVDKNPQLFKKVGKTSSHAVVSDDVIKTSATTKIRPTAATSDSTKKINEFINDYVSQARDILRSYQEKNYTLPGTDTKENVTGKWRGEEQRLEIGVRNYINKFDNISNKEKTQLNLEFKNKLAEVTASFNKWITENPQLFTKVSKTSPTLTGAKPIPETDMGAVFPSSDFLLEEHLKHSIILANKHLDSLRIIYTKPGFRTADEMTDEWNKFIKNKETNGFNRIDSGNISQTDKAKLKTNHSKQLAGVTASFIKWINNNPQLFIEKEAVADPFKKTLESKQDSLFKKIDEFEENKKKVDAKAAQLAAILEKKKKKKKKGI